MSDETKQYMQQAATEFLCFIASEALDVVMTAQNNTVTNEDVLSALSTLDFQLYAGSCYICLYY